MPRLELTFFGSPRLSLDGSPIHNRIDKAVALIALLALNGPTLHRDMLITWLWTHSTISKGQAALRTALWRLKDTGLTPWLEIDREFISLRKDEEIWIDVDEFQANLDKAKQPPHDQTTSCHLCTPWLEQAVALYRNDFMAGYSPRNAAEFDEWRSQYGQQLHNDYLLALERLTKGYHKQGVYGNAIQMAKRWIAVDPYNEEAHSMIMRSYTNNDQRANAIAHYRGFKRLLEKKQTFTPSREITALYKHILNGNNPPAMPSAPLKDPAFLLMDISRLPDHWIKHGRLMERVLDRLTNLVKDAIHKFGGRLVKHTEDGFLIFFEHGQPLFCAIAIHRMVAQTKWGLPNALNVRMVLTTTPIKKGSYPQYSPELVSCRALLYAATGNQILLTGQAMRTLELPISCRVHNLGGYFLPGQVNPTQVFELVHPHIQASEQNGLRNLVRSPTNLPVQSTNFVGRENELKQLASLLAQPECRLLNLIGPGGVGKTRLGIQLISQLQKTPQDGIYFISLALHHNPATLFRPIAEALNLTFDNPGDQTSQLISYLKSKRMLLVLDNFEHLTDAKTFLIKLLQGAPGLKIILTSRESLNLNMETIFKVRGLPYPQQPDDPEFAQYDGVKLFIQNGQRISPGFMLRPEDRSHIIQICTQVDGLPLGIELASAWVRALSCRDIAISIQQNLDFLQTHNQDVPLRHRSLRATFEHSWQLLSEEDRRIIGKLSIFSNGFSPHAAEQLTNATPILLASYIDKSMLTWQSDGRYLMPEVLRVFVLEHNKSDQREYETLLDLHSHYYLNKLISSFIEFAGENAASVIRELWLDADNIRSAINRAIDRHNWSLLLASIDPLMSFFELQGRLREGRDNAVLLIERITDMVGMQQPDIYYSLLGWEGTLSFRLGFSQEGFDKMKARLEYAQHQGDLMHTANTLMLLADAHRRHGEYTTALQEINQSLAILHPLSTTDNPLLSGFHANALCILGSIQLGLEQVESAREAADRCSAVLQRAGTRYVKIRLLELQARLANIDHKYEHSLELRQEALTIAEDFNDRRNVAIMLNNMGDTAEHLGGHESALGYLVRASQISEEIGDRQISALFNNNLGYTSMMLNHIPDSIRYYQKSIALYREIGNRHGLFFTLRDISRPYLLEGDAERALGYIVEAMHLGIELNDPLQILALLTVIARLMALVNRPKRTMELCRIVVDHPQATFDQRKEARSYIATSGIESGNLPKQVTITAEPTLPTFHSLLAELEKLPISTQISSTI